MDVKFDRYSLIINGERVFVRSGAFHYFRTPGVEVTKDRFMKLKSAGYDTVDIYFCASYHCPEEGVYDFAGISDHKDGTVDMLCHYHKREGTCQSSDGTVIHD